LEVHEVSFFIDEVGPIELRPARPKDVERMFSIHKQAMAGYVEETWGWVEDWQVAHFREHFNDRDKRRIESTRERLRAQGVGEDEATRQVIEEVASDQHSGAGGGSHSAGEPQKRTRHGGWGRTGSQSGGGK
jgi:hypothetical protein